MEQRMKQCLEGKHSTHFTVVGAPQDALITAEAAFARAEAQAAINFCSMEILLFLFIITPFRNFTIREWKSNSSLAASRR